VAADAGHHGLTLLHKEPVVLNGLRVGIHVGLVMAAVGFLVAIRIGLAALCLGILLCLRIRAPGVPVCLLGNVIAVLDVDVGAFRLVGRFELDTRVVADIALVVTVATVPCAVAAGRCLERDRVGRK